MEWEPIETAPKDGTDVLVFAPSLYGENKFQVAYCFYGQLWEYGYEGTPITPTHWMPLPKPPAD